MRFWLVVTLTYCISVCFCKSSNTNPVLQPELNASTDDASVLQSGSIETKNSNQNRNTGNNQPGWLAPLLGWRKKRNAMKNGNDVKSDNANEVHKMDHKMVGIPDRPSSLQVVNQKETISIGKSAYRSNPAWRWSYQNGDAEKKRDDEIERSNAEDEDSKWEQQRLRGGERSGREVDGQMEGDIKEDAGENIDVLLNNGNKNVNDDGEFINEWWIDYINGYIGHDGNRNGEARAFVQSFSKILKTLRKNNNISNQDVAKILQNIKNYLSRLKKTLVRKVKEGISEKKQIEENQKKLQDNQKKTQDNDVDEETQDRPPNNGMMSEWWIGDEEQQDPQTRTLDEEYRGPPNNGMMSEWWIGDEEMKDHDGTDI